MEALERQMNGDTEGGRKKKRKRRKRSEGGEDEETEEDIARRKQAKENADYQKVMAIEKKKRDTCSKKAERKILWTLR